MTATATLTTYKMYIDGQWVDAASRDHFESDDPVSRRALGAHSPRHRRRRRSRRPRRAQGVHLRRVAEADARRAAARCCAGSAIWSPSARQQLAEIEVRDNGKLYAEMSTQTAYMAQWYHYYGGLADKIEGAVLPTDKPDIFNYTRYEPLGVVAAIVPWNSPLLLTTWKLAPALAAGNTVVIKPSEFTSASVLEFMKLVEDAGFPPGVVNVVTGFGADVGAPLVEHPLVAKVAFTGSDATGQRIYEAAARGLKRVTMELGGKSPNIVFDDAEIDNAVKGVISGIFAATGQTCIAGSRLLVQESIHDQFLEQLVAFAQDREDGEPDECRTRRSGRSRTSRSSRRSSSTSTSRRARARSAVLGGGRATRPECGNGWFVEPTIFAGVNNRMRIAQEEVFGPVLVGDSVQGRGGGDRDRQRRGLRPGRRRVDAEHAPRADDGRAAAGRHGLGQHLSRGQLPVAVRRLQAIGHRARERSGDDQGIPAGEERVDLDGDGRAESVHSDGRR